MNTIMRTLLAILLTATAFGFVGCSQNKEGDNYVQVAAEDAAMKAAIQKGKATVDDFVRAFQAQKPGTKDYFVKKAFRTPSGGSEYMWIEVHAIAQENLEGQVANEAEETREVKIGQRVSLKVSEISDWKYQDGNKLVGGYTIRYFVERMSPKEREAFLKEAGFDL